MMESPYRKILKERFSALSPILQEFHGDYSSWSGKAVFDVSRKPGFFPLMISWMGGLPGPGKAVQIGLKIQRTEKGEWWFRDFAGHKLPSFQWAGPDLLYERFGNICLGQTLSVDQGNLVLKVIRAWNFGIPIPPFLSPSGLGIETQSGKEIGVCARAFFPFLGELVRYEGLLLPQAIIK